MAGAHYYRTEAERCRKRAADDPASESAKRWLQLAAEYEQLADALEAAGGRARRSRSSADAAAIDAAAAEQGRGRGARRKPRLIETAQREDRTRSIAIAGGSRVTAMRGAT